jgi:hypothetical protein
VHARARPALLAGPFSGPRAMGLSIGVFAHHGSSGPTASMLEDGVLREGRRHVAPCSEP